MYLRGDRIRVAHGWQTVTPSGDFETYSEAGYDWGIKPGYWKQLKKGPVWVPEKQILVDLPNQLKGKHGLDLVGTYNYVRHPTFELICLAYNLRDGYGPRFWRHGDPPPFELMEWLTRYMPGQPDDCIDGLWKSHNNFFEVTVWNEHCVPVLGWYPLIDLRQMRDSMAEAAAFKVPRGLGNLGIPLKLNTQKDKEGKALIRKLTVPRNPTARNPERRLTPQTAHLEFQKFYAYCVGDVLTESEASERMPELAARELRIWRADQAINHRGVYVNRRVVSDAIEIANQAYAKYNAELSELTHGEVKKSSQVKETLAFLARCGVHLDSLDEETVTEELKKPHPPGVLRILKIRELLSFGTAGKFFSMQYKLCSDSRLRDQYAYAGAHTDLWNGQDVQIANLYKGTINNRADIEAALAAVATRSLERVEAKYGNALEHLANCLRSAFQAAPGHRLIMSDYSAIQAVVLAGLAGEQWQLDVFRTHGKIYESTAAMLTGKTLEEYAAYKKQYGKHHPDRQLYGKIPTLASGFGAWIGGWRKFDKDGILGDDAEVKALILKTRGRIQKTVEFWGGQTRNKFGRDLNGNRANEYPELYGLEGCIVAAILEPGKCFGFRNVRFMVQDDILYCQPPGNCTPLLYHSPRLEPSQKDWARPWEWDIYYMTWVKPEFGAPGWYSSPLYGGVATQNVTAKCAREYQADSLVAMEESGIYLPVLHTHDEIVTEVKNGVGSVDGYRSLVCVARDGCVNIDDGTPWPVKVPGVEEELCYGKYD